MNNLISVIIPVYNSGKYLERCLNSLIAQTHKDLEIIKGHKRAIETTLYESDDITKGIIKAHYFNDTKLDSIAQDLETTTDFCNKLRRRYLNTLATELRLLK